MAHTYFRRMILKSYFTVFSLVAVTFCLKASDLPIIESLNDDMVQSAQTAAHINQNIDYQPFILSVWNQNELISFGAHTLKDALMLVPGVDMMGDTLNNRTPVIRGSNPLAYGQTKLAIDGVVVNDQTFDSYNAYLDLPIELIQRIEVVRGSGSFMEGVNGYSGSINVITYAKNENELHKGAIFGSFGNNSANQLGFWYSHHADKWKFSTDLFYQSNDNVSPIQVTDKYGNSGFAPLNSRQIGFGLTYVYENFSLKGRLNQFKSGSAFGNLNALPNLDGKQFTPSWYVEGSYTQPITHDLTLQAKAGAMESDWGSEARSLPAGTYNGITFPNGYWAYLNFSTRSLYANLSASYTGIKNNSITAGLTQKYDNVIDMSSVTTQRIDGGTALVDYTHTAPFINADLACRHTNEIYINDTIEINQELAFSLNAGGTKVSNLAFHPYARGALVYQPYRQHIFKMMVGNSYRLPSFQEMYTINNPARIGNPALSPEHVTSYEAQYIYKPSLDYSLGINVFYLKNKDQITANTTDKTFQNIGERNILGFETEFRGSIGENDLIALSYSYISGETIKGDEHTDFLPYASSHLIKGAFSYAITPQIKAGIVGRYASAKDRRPNDLRNPMPSFSSMDMVLGWENNQGLYVQGAIKNITDSVQRYPSTPLTYPDDYPVEGSTFWVRTGWKF